MSACADDAPPTHDPRRCGKRGTHQLHNKRALRHPANGTEARGSSTSDSRRAIAIVSDSPPQIIYPATHTDKCFGNFSTTSRWCDSNALQTLTKLPRFIISHHEIWLWNMIADCPIERAYSCDHERDRDWSDTMPLADAMMPSSFLNQKEGHLSCTPY